MEKDTILREIASQIQPKVPCMENRGSGYVIVIHGPI